MFRLNDPLVKRFLLIPSIVLATSGFIFGVLGGTQYEFLLETEAENSHAVQEINRLLQRVKFMRNQESLFLQYGSQYTSVTDKGLVQNFDRVPWVDGLLKIKEELVMNPLVIQIEPETKLEAKDFQKYILRSEIFYYTRINLFFGLQSDADLIQMQHLIATRISPLFYTEKCEVDKPVKDDKRLDFSESGANLLGNCSIIVFQAKPNSLKVDSDL